MRDTAIAVALFAIGCGPPRGESVDAGGDGGGTVDADMTVVDSVPAVSGPVDVVITADNAYSFGYGTNAAITNFTQGQRAQTA